MGIVPEAFADILESNALAYLATLGPGGAPQVSPVWFIWDGAVLRFSTLKARQKGRNLARDGRCAVAITDPANPYRSLEMRGRVVLVDDPEKLYPQVINAEYQIDLSKKKSDEEPEQQGELPATPASIDTSTVH